MAEITFVSHKTRKETNKIFFVILFAVITWILQVSVFAYFLYFDATPNLMLLGSIYFGLITGPLGGTLFGINSSFFSSCILYDHVFYLSYPLIGFLSGLLTKNIFSDEMLFFILLSFFLSFPLELLNGWQYSLNNSVDIFDRFFLIAINGAILNLFLAPLYYYLMNYVTKKLKLR